MSVIKSSASSSQWIIDTTSLAGRTTEYTPLGNAFGAVPTYVAASVAKAVVPTASTPFFFLAGSSTKVIRILKVTVAVTLATTASYVDIALWRRTTAQTSSFGTSPTTITPTALTGSTASTATSVRLSTAVTPVAGSGGGVVGMKLIYAPVTATGTPIDYAVFDYTAPRAQPIMLNSVTDGFEISFATAPGTAPTVTVEVVYTEE